jgi:hypothetical protein
MGLDNMPMTYPCENIAIRNSEGQIDCDETQKAGRCAYLNEYANDPIVNKTVAVRGMFGTDCWYRGKYGNILLEDMMEKSQDFAKEIKWDFYGDEEDGISEDACLHMSKVMFNYAEAWSKVVHDKIKNGEVIEERKEELIKDWIYAAWWLKFAGIYGYGSAIWY